MLTSPWVPPAPAGDAASWRQHVPGAARRRAGTQDGGARRPGWRGWCGAAGVGPGGGQGLRGRLPATGRQVTRRPGGREGGDGGGVSPSLQAGGLRFPSSLWGAPGCGPSPDSLLFRCAGAPPPLLLAVPSRRPAVIQQQRGLAAPRSRCWRRAAPGGSGVRPGAGSSVVFRSSDACPSASPWWICFLGAVGIRVKGECPPGEGGFLAAVTRSYVESPFLLVWMGWGQCVAVVELSFGLVVFLWCLHCENHNIQSSLWCYISAVFSRVFAGWRAEVLFTVWVVAILISLHAHYLFLEHFQLAVPLLSWKESHIVCIWDADIPWMYIIA